MHGSSLEGVPMLAFHGSALAALAALAHAGPMLDRCSFATAHQDGTIALHALVHGPGATAGSYSLSVEVLGPGGRSIVSQGGDFRIPAGSDSALVSVMHTSSGAGAHLVARLIATAGGRDVVCAIDLPQE
jgi:hypothetical protein